MQAGAAREQEMQWAVRWRDAPRGQGKAVMDAASKALGQSPATLYRKFKQLVAVVKPPRKRRSDAGKCALSREEALTIATTLKEHMRLNGRKAMFGMEDMMNELRANRMVEATRVDPATGEVLALSKSTIYRALELYDMHPTQQAQPAPVTRLRSLHPNHVWQIDASRCVLYYLPRQNQRESGLHVMDAEKFNKNKPANLIRAIKDALWRYVVTDHTSGWIYVQYVLDGESAVNAIDTLIGAMSVRQNQPMHGVPKMLMLDLGGANTSAAFTGVCQALGVKWWFNARGNPRGKGQVENAQNIVERKFESRLKTMPSEAVATLAQINALAQGWVRTFNATAVHSRHGMTRDVAWMKIKPHELVAMPDAALLRKMAVSPPQEREVKRDLTVNFEGKQWDVAGVPGVSVKQKLLVCRNAFDTASIHALGQCEDGMQVFHVLPQVMFNEYGQRLDAPVIGEAYQRHADTPVQTNVKAMERLAMGAATDTEAAQKRKAGTRFMDGRFDPFATTKAIEAGLPIPMPRKGQAHGLDALQPAVRDPALLTPMLTHIQAAKRLPDVLAAQFGTDWSDAHYAQMKVLYPEGVPEDDLPTVAGEILAALGAAPRMVAAGGERRGHLQLVG